MDSLPAPTLGDVVARVGRRFLAVAPLIGLVSGVGLLQLVPPVAQWFRDHLVAVVWTLFGMVLASLAGILIQTYRRERVLFERDQLRQSVGELCEEAGRLRLLLDDRRQPAETATLKSIVAAMPTGAVEWLKGHDFGGSWTDSDIRPIDRLGHVLTGVTGRFLDPEVEALRQRLIGATNRFLECLSLNSGLAEAQPLSHATLMDIMPRSVRDRSPESKVLFEHRRRELNDLADGLVSAYEGLVDAARKRFHVAFSDGSPGTTTQQAG